MSRPRLYTDEQAYALIARMVCSAHRPPTIAEMVKGLRVGSTRTVLRYLQRLERAGMIRRQRGSRGVVLLVRFPEELVE